MSRNVQKAIKYDKEQIRVNGLLWHGNCPRALSYESEIIEKEFQVKTFKLQWVLKDSKVKCSDVKANAYIWLESTRRYIPIMDLA